MSELNIIGVVVDPKNPPPAEADPLEQAKYWKARWEHEVACNAGIFKDTAEFLKMEGDALRWVESEVSGITVEWSGTRELYRVVDYDTDEVPPIYAEEAEPMLALVVAHLKCTKQEGRIQRYRDLLEALPKNFPIEDEAADTSS